MKGRREIAVLVGRILLLLFLIPTTLIFHNIWADPKRMIHFMKNAAIFGGLIVFLAAGPGAFRLDHLFRRVA
jgi:putative oxidoreductase